MKAQHVAQTMPLWPLPVSPVLEFRFVVVGLAHLQTLWMARLTAPPVLPGNVMANPLFMLRLPPPVNVRETSMFAPDRSEQLSRPFPMTPHWLSLPLRVVLSEEKSWHSTLLLAPLVSRLLALVTVPMLLSRCIGMATASVQSHARLVVRSVDVQPLHVLNVRQPPAQEELVLPQAVPAPVLGWTMVSISRGPQLLAVDLLVRRMEKLNNALNAMTTVTNTANSACYPWWITDDYVPPRMNTCASS